MLADKCVLVFYGSASQFSWLFCFLPRIKDNPPAKDDLSVDECEHIVVSMIVERVLEISPVWGSYE
jgi:hypothetical protein